MLEQINPIILFVAFAMVVMYFFRCKSCESFENPTINTQLPGNSSHRTCESSKIINSMYNSHGVDEIEGFVPWNSQNVGKFQISMIKADQLGLEQSFQKLVNNDKNKINLINIGQFRQQPVIQEQGRAFINHVLKRINTETDRRFNILDIMTLNKESTFDINDKKIINRYTTELFIQEKDARKVSAHAMSIRMVFVVKDNVLQLLELKFITDSFYQRPLVDGYNPNIKSTISSSNTSTFGEEYFRILNPFNLHQPFFTSEDKILPPDNKHEEILINHHNDAVSPQYRCFEGVNNKTGKTKDECDLTDGYWDKPVTRDEECPFFMANKNYPNRLGGVDPNGNSCEMPIGTKKIGYRYVSSDPINKPWCANCRIGNDGSPGGAGPCCEEQLNKDLYPNLVSPDYIYPGDALERGQFWKELSERGLNWQLHPTKIRDVTNPLQKQPIFNAIIGPGPGKIDLP